MLTCSNCDGLTPIDAGTACLHCGTSLKPKSNRLAWVVGSVGTMLLAACYGPSGRYRGGGGNPFVVDRDGDGASVRRVCADEPTDGAKRVCEADQANGKQADLDPKVVDCDDKDPGRYPGAVDPKGDGIDQNCDGVND